MSIKNKIRGIKEIWHFDNRWYLGFTKILFPNEKINIYKIGDIEILTDHSAGDANGAREVITSDMYSKYLKQMNLSEEINVLDLGANNGGFSLLIKSKGLKIKKTVCVELNPKTFSRLKFNLERNFFNKHIAINSAIVGYPRDIEVNLGSGGASDSIYLKKGEDKYIVNGITFDDVFDKHFQNEIVDLCKIDIEGAEFEIFQNKNYKNLKNCKYILMEIHHESDRNREFVIEKMKASNFTEIDGDCKKDKLHYVHFFENVNFK